MSGSGLAFPALQFAFHGFAHEVRSVLAFLKDSLNSRERPLREARLHVLSPSFLATHPTGHIAYDFFCRIQIISHMRY